MKKPDSKTGPNAFTLKVIAVIRGIPRGRVATYKQVAGLSGKGHASRAVAWILNSCSMKYELPWQRVINSEGKISFAPRSSQFLLQRRLLTKEGVKVLPGGEVDLAKYQYRKKARIRHQRNQPRMFS